MVEARLETLTPREKEVMGLVAQGKLNKTIARQMGIDHVRYEGMHCETLGYSPHERKNDEKFANRGEWADQTVERRKHQ